MKRLKKITIIMLFVLLLCGCGNGITQEQYDEVVKERDELKTDLEEKRDSESLKKVKEEFSEFDNFNFFESEQKNGKVLIVDWCTDLSDSDVGSKIGEWIKKDSIEEWFDYDYVYINAWNKGLGILLSMEIGTNPLSVKCYDWTVEENISKEDETKGEKEDENRLIYEDDYVNIYYTGFNNEETKFEINFLIENKSGETISVQARETSINGFMADSIFSPEIAPGKKKYDKLTFYKKSNDGIDFQNISSIETKFHIFESKNWENRYDTENIIVK